MKAYKFQLISTFLLILVFTSCQKIASNIDNIDSGDIYFWNVHEMPLFMSNELVGHGIKLGEYESSETQVFPFEEVIPRDIVVVGDLHFQPSFSGVLIYDLELDQEIGEILISDCRVIKRISDENIALGGYKELVIFNLVTKESTVYDNISGNVKAIAPIDDSSILYIDATGISNLNLETKVITSTADLDAQVFLGVGSHFYIVNYDLDKIWFTEINPIDLSIIRTIEFENALDGIHHNGISYLIVEDLLYFEVQNEIFKMNHDLSNFEKIELVDGLIFAMDYSQAREEILLSVQNEDETYSIVFLNKAEEITGEITMKNRISSLHPL